MSLTDALKQIAKDRGVRYGEFHKPNRNQNPPRVKFIKAIEHNIKLLKDPSYRYRRNGKDVKPTPWWEELNDGTLAIRPRYGIALLVEDEAVYAKDKQQAIEVLTELKGAANRGDFDTELKKASEDSRQKLADARNRNQNTEEAA
jgi:hypothetical protein